jgi:hypothetical protein
MHLIEPDHIIWTMLGAISAVPAYEGLVVVFVPEDRAEYAGLHAGAASGASLRFQKHAAAFAQRKRVFRTGTRAWRVFAGAADREQKTVLHTSGRLDPYAGFGKPGIFVYARAGKHAALTAYALVRVCYLKPHVTFPL